MVCGKKTPAKPPDFSNCPILSTNRVSIVSEVSKILGRSSNSLCCNFKCALKAETAYGGLATKMSNLPFSMPFAGSLSNPSLKMILASPAPFIKRAILLTRAKR